MIKKPTLATQGPGERGAKVNHTNIYTHFSFFLKFLGNASKSVRVKISCFFQADLWAPFFMDGFVLASFFPGDCLF